VRFVDFDGIQDEKEIAAGAKKVEWIIDQIQQLNSFHKYRSPSLLEIHEFFENFVVSCSYAFRQMKKRYYDEPLLEK
jgi:hypothetical protein